MAAKNDIDITIGGKTYTLSGVESETYLREVASYLNEKIRSYADDASYWRLPNDMRNVMLQLNLADDYFKEHGRAQELEARVEELGQHRDRALQELEDMQGAAQEAASRISALETDAEDLRNQAQRSAAAETSAAKRFGAEKSRAEKLSAQMDALRKSKEDADQALERLRQELAQTRDSLQGELNRTRADLEQKLAASEARRKKEVQELQTLRKKEVQEQQALRIKEVQELQALRRKEVSELQGRHAQELQETKTVSEQHKKSLDQASEEIKKLRSQRDIALLNEENARKKLADLEKSFADRLAADTEPYRARALEVQEDLEKTREELMELQEQENTRLQAASRVRSTMQELVQQYGRFGQSLEEAADQMRALS